MSKFLCIYHGSCQDGFGAAWAVRHALSDENVDFYPGVYQNDPPDVTDRDVLIVDFSYKRPVLVRMAEEARSVLILDHHRSAAEDLNGILPPIVWRNGECIAPASYEDWLADSDAADQPLAAIFDMERSGAAIAWDYFHPDKPRPQVLNHI